MAVTLDEPVLVVSLLPRFERLAQLFDGIEGADPQELLFEGADDSLGTAVSLRSAHESGARCDAQERDLVLESIGQVSCRCSVV